MIKIEMVSKEDIDNGCFLNVKDFVLSECDKDFYNAKDKIDLDLINEKIRLELYKIDLL